MSRLARDGTAEPVSRDQIPRRERGQGNTRLPCSADDVQDWQPYPVDPYSAICVTIRDFERLTCHQKLLDDIPNRNGYFRHCVISAQGNVSVISAHRLKIP